MEEELLWKSQVLNEKRPELCQCLKPKEHYPWLRSKYILSREDEETIESQMTTREKVHRLIDILLKRLPQGFDELVKSLIDCRTQTHLAKMLNEEFENKRRNCYARRNHVDEPQSCQSSISDLGVDTDKLPKPQLPKKLYNRDKDNDELEKNSENDIILELDPRSK